MFYCLYALVTLGLLLSPAAAQGWNELRIEGAGYAVEMPNKPTVGTEQIQTKAGPVTVYAASTKAGPATYVTTFASSSSPVDAIKDTHGFFDNARNGAVAGAKGKLRSEKEVTVSGRPGREIIIDQGAGGVTILRMFLYGRTLIQAFVSGPLRQLHKCCR